MIVYRITNRKHAHDLSGAGASQCGGRWNRKGTSVLYTGESREITLLEIIVHTPPMLIPELDILTLGIPDDSVKIVDPDRLPSNWKDYPAPTVLSEIGENWVRSGESLALKVPSAIIHSAWNYILNCRHPRYNEVKVLDHSSFNFDQRLKK